MDGRQDYACDTCEREHTDHACVYTGTRLSESEKEFIKSIGCASHSSFNGTNHVDLALKAIEVWWGSYSPIPKKPENMTRNNRSKKLAAYDTRLHHHHIKRRIFLKYHRLLEMTLTEDGRKLLTEFIKNPLNKSDEVKGQFVVDYNDLKNRG